METGTRQIVMTAQESEHGRRGFAIGDRLLFRSEWWVVVGVYFVPRGESRERVYVLQQAVPAPEAGGS